MAGSRNRVAFLQTLFCLEMSRALICRMGRILFPGVLWYWPAVLHDTVMVLVLQSGEYTVTDPTCTAELCLPRDFSHLQCLVWNVCFKRTKRGCVGKVGMQVVRTSAVKDMQSISTEEGDSDRNWLWWLGREVTSNRKVSGVAVCKSPS